MFWCLSPREFDALRRQWKQHGDRMAAFHAGLQATLHNTSQKIERKGGGWFTPEEFMPGYVRPRQSLEDQMLAIKTALECAAAFNESQKPPS